jgi:hypothetical protein
MNGGDSSSDATFVEMFAHRSACTLLPFLNPSGMFRRFSPPVRLKDQEASCDARAKGILIEFSQEQIGVREGC